MNSAVRSVAKTTLSAANAVLPARLASALGDAGFSAYRMGLRLLYSRHILAAAVRGDQDELLRRRSVLTVMPFSLVGSGGLEATFDAVRSIESESVRGAVVECGVAQGGCAALMGMVIRAHGSRRRLWLFDSFEGLPDPGEHDIVDGKTGDHIRELPRGSCLGTIEQVEDLLFGHFAFDRGGIELVKGWFDKTIPPKAQDIGPIAVLRIDADWYESVMVCLETLFEQIDPAGRIIIDDYGTCYGAKKAVDEYRSRRNITTPMTEDGRGGVVFRKQ